MVSEEWGPELGGRWGTRKHAILGRNKDKEIFCKKTKPVMYSFSAHSPVTLQLLKWRCNAGQRKLLQAPAAIKSSVSAAFTETGQLQRFRFHLESKQLYERALILVKLISFIVGLDGVFEREIVSDCQRTGVWGDRPLLVSVHVVLNISSSHRWVGFGLWGAWKRHFHRMGHSGQSCYTAIWAMSKA